MIELRRFKVDLCRKTGYFSLFSKLSIDRCYDICFTSCKEKSFKTSHNYIFAYYSLTSYQVSNISTISFYAQWCTDLCTHKRSTRVERRIAYRSSLVKPYFGEHLNLTKLTSFILYNVILNINYLFVFILH